MADEQIEIFKAMRAADDRYDYFLLAVAGAATAFALNQTKDLSLAATQIPLGLALLSWGLSFYCGCQHLIHVRSQLWDNGQLLKIKAGQDPMIGGDPLLTQMAVKIISESHDKGSKRSAAFALWQYRFLIFGSVMYILWHVYEMYNRGLTHH